MNRSFAQFVGSLGVALVVCAPRPASGDLQEITTPEPRCQGSVQDVTLAGYVADLETIRRDLAGATASQAAGFAARLPACWRVRDGGRELIVESAWLRRALSAPSQTADMWSERRTSLDKRLAAVGADASQWTADASAQTRHARHELRGVLAQREFQRANRTSWTESLGRRLRDWIEEQLRSLTGRRLPLRMLGSALAWVVGIGALVALCVWMFRLRRTGSSALDLDIEAPRLTSNEWASLAREAIGRGDAREAGRCVYHAALYRFEEQGLWRVDAARTPREYLRLVPAADARRGIVGEVTRDFERAWYARETPDAGRLLAQLEAIGCRARPDAAI